ncbi:hypothetical protein ACRRTK_001805 [Alexandromys fortis]
MYFYFQRQYSFIVLIIRPVAKDQRIFFCVCAFLNVLFKQREMNECNLLLMCPF